MGALQSRYSLVHIYYVHIVAKIEHWLNYYNIAIYAVVYMWELEESHPSIFPMLDQKPTKDRYIENLIMRTAQ